MRGPTDSIRCPTGGIRGPTDSIRGATAGIRGPIDSIRGPTDSIRGATAGIRGTIEGRRAAPTWRREPVATACIRGAAGRGNRHCRGRLFI
jgi:hypothetical protein